MAGKRRTEKARPGSLAPKFTHLTSLSTFFTSLYSKPCGITSIRPWDSFCHISHPQDHPHLSVSLHPYGHYLRLSLIVFCLDFCLSSRWSCSCLSSSLIFTWSLESFGLQIWPFLRLKLLSGFSIQWHRVVFPIVSPFMCDHWIGGTQQKFE